MINASLFYLPFTERSCLLLEPMVWVIHWIWCLFVIFTYFWSLSVPYKYYITARLDHTKYTHIADLWRKLTNPLSCSLYKNLCCWVCKYVNHSGSFLGGMCVWEGCRWVTTGDSPVLHKLHRPHLSHISEHLLSEMPLCLQFAPLLHSRVLHHLNITIYPRHRWSDLFWFLSFLMDRLYHLP